MKRFIVFQVLALFLLIQTVHAQFFSEFHNMRDTLTTTDGDVSYRDTLLYTIQVWDADLSDTNSVFELVYNVDTTETGTSSWADSGCLPGVKIEMRYIPPPGADPLDSISINGHTGVQWKSLMDSIGTFQGHYGHVLVHLLPLSNSIQLRVRDIAETRKRGTHHGKFVHTVLRGVRRRY